MVTSAQILSFVIPIILILAGLVGGFVAERWLLRRLRLLARRTPWIADNLVVSALQGMMTLWFVLAGIYGAVLSLTLRPSVLALVEKILLALLLGSITLIIARLAVRFVELYSRRSEAALPLTSLFENLTRLLILLIGILIILQSLGVAITPLLTALGVGGISIGLALQNTLSNLFSGLSIILSRKVRPGDYLQLTSGEEGYVTDITWRAITLEEIEQNLIIIPNSKLLAGNFKNCSLPEKEMVMAIEVGVGYGSDLEEVEQVTLQVARQVLLEVEGGVPDFEPFVTYYEFSDFRINFRVFLKVAEFIDRRHIRHEFIKRIHRAYRQHKIKIPFPIRTIYTQDSHEDFMTND